MSKTAYHQADDKLTGSAMDTNEPEGQVHDDSYVTSRQKGEPVPVQRDDAPVEEPVSTRGADSDKQLGKLLPSQLCRSRYSPKYLRAGRKGGGG